MCCGSTPTPIVTYMVLPSPLNRRYCGVTIKVEATTRSLAPLSVPVVFIGINRVPSGNLSAQDWDCVIDPSVPAPPGAALPVCDLPYVTNATYFVVASSSGQWDVDHLTGMGM